MILFCTGLVCASCYSESLEPCQPKSRGLPGGIVSVETLCVCPFIDQLVTPDGIPLSPDASVQIGLETTKTVRMGGKQVIVAKANEDARFNGIAFRTITKQEAKAY